MLDSKKRSQAAAGARGRRMHARPAGCRGRGSWPHLSVHAPLPQMEHRLGRLELTGRVANVTTDGAAGWQGQQEVRNGNGRRAGGGGNPTTIALCGGGRFCWFVSVVYGA